MTAPRRVESRPTGASDPPLAGRVAVVTGASRGVGRAVAVELARLGANVVATARTQKPRPDIGGTLAETLGAVEAVGGTAITFPADLLQSSSRQDLVSETLASFGRVDVLVNNAAYIGDAVFESFWEMDEDDWRRMIELNVSVPWVLTKAFAPTMRDHGGGLVVNLSSGAAHSPDGSVGLPLPGHGGLGAAYPTSKAALNQLTAHVGNELRAVGIAMVAIDPGFARSESAELLASRIGADPKWAQPVDVAAKAIGHIASTDPMTYAGRFVVARELVEQFQLLDL